MAFTTSPQTPSLSYSKVTTSSYDIDISSTSFVYVDTDNSFIALMYKNIHGSIRNYSTNRFVGKWLMLEGGVGKTTGTFSLGFGSRTDTLPIPSQQNTLCKLKVEGIQDVTNKAAYFEIDMIKTATQINLLVTKIYTWEGD